MKALESTTQTQTPVLPSGWQGLFDQLQGQIGALPEFNFQDYLHQAFGGPQFQEAARGLTGALQPLFQQQQLQLQDQFRSANVLPSSMFAQGMGNLMGQQGLQQNRELSQLAQSMLGTSLQAGQLGLQSALAPITAGMGLLQAMPKGMTGTSTENVDMGAMLQLLAQMKGATGGASMGGGTGGGSGNPSLDALIKALMGRSDGMGGNQGTSGNQMYDWFGQLRNPPPASSPVNWPGLGGGGPSGQMPGANTGIWGSGTSYGSGPVFDPNTGMSTIDQWGYTPQDWLDDPFYQ